MPFPSTVVAIFWTVAPVPGPSGLDGVPGPSVEADRASAACADFADFAGGPGVGSEEPAESHMSAVGAEKRVFP